jgi:hypothetical protein
MVDIADYLYVSQDFDTIYMRITPHIWNDLSTNDFVTENEDALISDMLIAYVKVAGCQDYISRRYQILNHHDLIYEMTFQVPSFAYEKFGQSHQNIFSYDPFETRFIFSVFSGLVGFKTCSTEYVRIRD